METNKSYYAIIPATVRYDKRLCANSKLLYGEITALCNEKGFCWASNQYFQDLYEVGKNAIVRWINELLTCEYIVKDIIYAEDGKTVLQRRLIIPNSNYLKVNENLEGDDSSKDTTPGIKKDTTPGIKKDTTPGVKKDTTPNTINNNKLINNYIYIYTREIDEALESLNIKINSNFQRTKEVESSLITIFNAGYTLDDVKTVIDKKFKQWNETSFAKYLRPATLFSSKFDSYLNEITSTTELPKRKRIDEEKPAGFKENEMVNKVLEYFNKEYLKNFRATQETIKVILERERDGYTFEDFKKVIYNAHQCLENHKNGAEIAKYFCPIRIFNSEWFDNYLNFDLSGDMIQHNFTPRELNSALTSIEDLNFI